MATLAELIGEVPNLDKIGEDEESILYFNHRAYASLVEFLYTNDRTFDSAKEWREALLNHVKDIFRIRVEKKKDEAQRVQ